MPSQEIAEVGNDEVGGFHGGEVPGAVELCQCSIVPDGSMTLLIVVSAANTATPFGGPAGWSAGAPAASGSEAAICRHARMPSWVAFADDATALVNQ